MGCSQYGYAQLAQLNTTIRTIGDQKSWSTKKLVHIVEVNQLTYYVNA